MVLPVQIGILKKKTQSEDLLTTGETYQAPETRNSQFQKGPNCLTFD